MELFSAEFFSSLLAIIVIDLALAGDNAILIGLAARNLPKEKQKVVILWGMVGAVVIRIIATVLVVYLLKIPGLLLVGGLMLVWIAYKLLTEEENEEDVKAATTIWGAVRTIIIADMLMGLDNVLAVAGAAEGHTLLVVIGLLISVPIVVWGSTVVIRLLERFPWLMYVGAGVLAWTAAKMITEEHVLEDFYADYPAVRWTILIGIVLLVLVAGFMKNLRSRTTPKET